jgi:hypothetical protein
MTGTPAGSTSAGAADLALVAPVFTAGLAAVADLAAVAGFAGAGAGFAGVWALAATVLAANNRIRTVFLMVLSSSG